MNYTSYFSQKFKKHGIPKLSIDQYFRLMNIVYLEGKLSNYKDFDEIMSSKSIHIQIQISKLTNELHPVHLYLEMISLSEKHFKNNS
jgi:hypothetical protein